MPALRRRGVGRGEVAGASAEIPGYRVLEEVGRGGFSVVYKAYQVALERVVALKVLTVGQAGDQAQQRFLREVRLTTRLSGHPHVVTVLDAGTTASGRSYLAMDYFQLGSLHDRLRDEGLLPAPDVAAIGVKIGGALSAAHELGILHRDIKPRNILVSRFGEPALADFGVALLASGPERTGQTDAITPYLTPYHAAPEILDGAEPSVAADIYSLGSTLYELLAGQPAYYRDGAGVGQMIARAMRAPPPPLTRPDVPEKVRQAVLRAMSRDPAGRFGTAAEFAAALGPAPAAAAGTGPQPSAATRLRAGETMLRPGRDQPGQPPPERPPRRYGWWQLALAACAAAVLAVSGVYIGLRQSAHVRPAPPAAARHHTSAKAPSGAAGGQRPRHTPSARPVTAAPPAPQPPSAPRSLAVTATASHSVTLGWSAPGSGGPVSYDVSWTGAVSSSVTGLTGTSFRITGLVNSATYSFSVTAVNPAGASQPATVSQALTPPAHPFNTFRNTEFVLRVRAQPNTGSQIVAVIPVLTASLGPQVIVYCQVTGEEVINPGGGTLAGDIWDKVTYQGTSGYISDLYVNTPQSVAGNYNSFSDPPLWQCT